MKEDWIECKIGDIFDFVGGGTPSKTNEKYWNGDIPWASIKDIKGDFLNSTINKITNEGLTNSASNLVAIDEVILATRINPGRPIISKINTSINQDLKVVKPRLELPSVFVFYLFKFLEKQIIGLSSGTTVLGIGLNPLKDIKFSLPPLPEQRAIVKKIESLFSSLDAGVADLKKAQQQLKIYRQAVLKKAFEGELTKEWREKNGLHFSLQNIKIIDLGNIVTGNTPSKSDVNNYKSEEYNFYKPTDLNKGLNINFSIDKVSAFAYEKSRKVYKDSILVTCIGATIGKTGLITKEGIFNQQINAIIPNEKYISKFIYFQIISSSFQNLLISKSSSTTMPIINKSKFQDLDFVAFSLSEQKEIVKQIESRLSVCDSIEQNIKESLVKAEALRQSILKKAFEGKLLTAQELAECKLAEDYEPAGVSLERIKAEQNKATAKPKTIRKTIAKK